MFDDALGMMEQCTARFRLGVHDTFGASIMMDILEPIIIDIQSLCSFDQEFQRHVHNIDAVLDEAKTITPNEVGSE